MAIGLTFFHHKTDTNSDKAKLAVYVALALGMFIVIPFFIQRTLRKHRYGLYLTFNKKRIGSLYLGIKIKEFNTIFCVFSFLLVRLFFVDWLVDFWDSVKTLLNVFLNLFYLLLGHFLHDGLIYFGFGNNLIGLRNVFQSHLGLTFNYCRNGLRII